MSHELISDNKFETFEDLLYLVKANKELSFYTLLIDSIRVIEYKPYYIKLSFVLKEYDDILKKIRKSLLALTKNNWRIEVVENEIKYNSISEKTEIDNNAVKNMIKDNLLVKSIIDGFENSKIIEIKKNK